MISFAPLRKMMTQKKLTTYTLRFKYGFGSGTVKRLMNDESVSTYTLDMLCKELECNLSDIAEFIPDSYKRIQIDY